MIEAKEQEDIDLETFVDLFDTAMCSDNPTIQRALKNLVLISAIVNAKNHPDELRKGPLRKLVDDITSIRKRLDQLEGAGAYRSTYSAAAQQLKSNAATSSKSSIKQIEIKVGS